MRYVVTGAAGFIGSHLAERLLVEEPDCEIIGIDSFDPFYSRGLKEANLSLLARSGRFRLIEDDIGALARASQAAGRIELDEVVSSADTVFHLAARAGVRTSWGDRFREYVENNVVATQLLLESCLRTGNPGVVFASSSSVYGEDAELPMRESARCRPYSPYGVTKQAAESLCELYGNNHSISTLSLRLFTVYGPRQRPDMAFHAMMRAMLTGREATLHGDGLQTREFTHVDDVVDGILLLQRKGATGVYNLGGGSRVSMRDAIREMERVTGNRLRVAHAASQKGDVRDTWACLEQAESLGYAPQVTLEAGLLSQWEWMNSVFDSRAHRGDDPVT